MEFLVSLVHEPRSSQTGLLTDRASLSVKPGNADLRLGSLCHDIAPVLLPEKTFKGDVIVPKDL